MILTYTGHEKDYETNLTYMLSRYYSQGYGRFLSPDPGYDYDQLDPMSWNLYSYVRGNPINHFDPTGKEKAVQGDYIYAMQHPINALLYVKPNAKKATHISNKLFLGKGKHNGIGDAFRHALWSAFYARDIGIEEARDAGRSHEGFPNNDIKEREMDLNNNEVGINSITGKKELSDEEVVDRVISAYENGELYIIQYTETGNGKTKREVKNYKPTKKEVEEVKKRKEEYFKKNSKDVNNASDSY